VVENLLFFFDNRKKRVKKRKEKVFCELQKKITKQTKAEKRTKTMKVTMSKLRDTMERKREERTNEGRKRGWRSCF
jgi:hypothetical protein